MTFWLKTPRTEPYTAKGIVRMRCVRCGRKAKYQWNVCADLNQFRPLCDVCDIELNEMILRWANDPDVERKMLAYRKIA